MSIVDSTASAVSLYLCLCFLLRFLLVQLSHLCLWSSGVSVCIRLKGGVQLCHLTLRVHVHTPWHLPSATSSSLALRTPWVTCTLCQEDCESHTHTSSPQGKHQQSRWDKSPGTVRALTLEGRAHLPIQGRRMPGQEPQSTRITAQ